MKNISLCILFLLMLSFWGCQPKPKAEEDAVTKVKTPVTVTTVKDTSISESISLNATSSYIRKNQVNSNANGFIIKLSANIGEYVSAGTPLFTIRTKEGEALSKLNRKDSLFNFKGEITILAPASGIITQVNKQLHDYVNDNDALAVIADQNSFVFLLNIPYELNKYSGTGTHCDIILPDSTRLTGTISSKLSSVDPVAQTQSYMIQVQTKTNLPENLIATVHLIKNTRQRTQVVDKSCVLANETMDNFWVMKLINDSVAVKVPVTKGITAESQIEIVSPKFNETDRIIKSGNYGLGDTALVSITNSK